MRSSVVLPAPLGPDDADALPALGGEERRAGHGHGLGGLGAVGLERAAAGQVADREVLEADHELAGPHRAAGERVAGQPQRLARLGRLDALLPQPLEPGLVLVHLHVLALAPVALDELDLARDRVLVRLGLALRPGVPLDALAVVGAVVAPEHRQPAIAQLPDPRHRGIEERAVVRRHEQGARAAPEVLLQPFDGADVEVVGRLVEQEQVRIGDDEAGERGPRLLAAGDRRGRAGPLVAHEPEARERLVDPLVERVAAQDVEAVLEVGVGGAGGVTVVLEASQLLGHPLEVRRAVPHGRAEVGRRHERLVEVRLLAQQAEAEAPLAGRAAAVRLVLPGGDPEQRRLAGAVGPDEADALPGSDRGRDPVEDHERADLAHDALEPDKRHGSPRSTLPERAATRHGRVLRPVARRRTLGPAGT